MEGGRWPSRSRERCAPLPLGELFHSRASFSATTRLSARQQCATSLEQPTSPQGRALRSRLETNTCSALPSVALCISHPHSRVQTQRRLHGARGHAEARALSARVEIIRVRGPLCRAALEVVPLYMPLYRTVAREAITGAPKNVANCGTFVVLRHLT